MSKRGENIYLRKDGRWEGRYIREKSANGKTRYGSVYGKKYSEVKQKLLLAKTMQQESCDNGPGYSGTLKEWIYEWLDTQKRTHIKASTYANYRNKLEYHVISVIGDKKLTEVEKDDIQRLVNHGMSNQLSDNSIRTLYRIVHSLFQSAVENGYLDKNPCNGVCLPKVRHQNRRALTREEQTLLEEKARCSKGNEAVIIALYTGLRIGEISALTWEEVDFTSHLIYVRRTRQRISTYEQDQKQSVVREDLPKSDSSYRSIPMGPFLTEYLIRLKSRAICSYVVCCKGRATEPRVILYRFRRLASEIGLDDVTFHSLRNTFATRCIEQGADAVTLSRLLGHTSAKMTLDIYVDATMEQQKAVIRMMESWPEMNQKEIAAACAGDEPSEIWSALS